MTREQLLKAIGGIEESLLGESEQKNEHKRVPVGRILLVAALVAALALPVLAVADYWAGLKAGEKQATNKNLSTGMVNFVYSEGYIYEGKLGWIYKYDSSGNVVEKYALDSKTSSPYYMFAADNGIVCTVDFNRLVFVPKNGSELKTVCQDISLTHVSVDGDQLYTMQGTTMLSRIDLKTMKMTDLLEDVNAYYVDDAFIYAVQSGKEKCYLRSDKEKINFEKIPLDFVPNKVIADGEDLYFCRWLAEEERPDAQKQLGYQVNLVRDGKTTPLPVYSWFYQILNGCVLYRDAITYELKSYDLITEKTSVLAEEVVDFVVLEDRYICANLLGKDSQSVILDMQTGDQIQTALP